MTMSFQEDYWKLRLATGDEQALKAIFEQYRTRLLQIAVQVLNSRELAEEVVMDTVLGLWEKRHRAVAIERLSAYLYTTVKNKSLNRLRTVRAHKHVALEDISPDIVLTVSPEELMVSAEAIHRIQEAINQLPPRCKQIFILIKEDKLKYREVADVMQISLKTVENQLGIALKKIHDALNRDDELV